MKEPEKLVNDMNEASRRKHLSIKTTQNKEHITFSP